MIHKEHREDWAVLLIIAVILFFLYSFDLREMFKRILEWGFALTGFKLLFDYGIIKGLKLVMDKR